MHTYIIFKNFKSIQVLLLNESYDLYRLCATLENDLKYLHIETICCGADVWMLRQ